MSFLHLTLLYCMLNAFFSDPTLEYPRSSQRNILRSIAAKPATPNDVERGATNILFQSMDGGRTWQDISHSLPENEEPEDFYAGESEIFLRVKNVLYRSRSNLKTPVWEKEDGLDPRSGRVRHMVEAEGVLIATGQSGIMRSTDNGEHWQWVIQEGGVGIAVERIDGGFAAISCNTTTMSRRIHISLDGGNTWKAIDDGLRPSLFISSIKQIGKYLICGHPDGIFRSSDLGKTWNIVHPSVDKIDFKFRTLNSDPFNDHRKVFKIYVSGDIVYAVAGSAGC